MPPIRNVPRSNPRGDNTVDGSMNLLSKGGSSPPLTLPFPFWRDRPAFPSPLSPERDRKSLEIKVSFLWCRSLTSGLFPTGKPCRPPRERRSMRSQFFLQKGFPEPIMTALVLFRVKLFPPFFFLLESFARGRITFPPFRNPKRTASRA